MNTCHCSEVPWTYWLRQCAAGVFFWIGNRILGVEP